MVIGKVNHYARIEILRRDYLMEEGFPNITYHEKNMRMQVMDNQEFTHNFSEVLIRRMLHEKKIPNFNIGGKLVYISDPIIIKELEEKNTKKWQKTIKQKRKYGTKMRLKSSRKG